MLSSLTSDDPSPSPFPRHTIKVYEEPRLREQDFGNFQPCSAAMEQMWQERADYGHFFYRIPNGESAADAYDRISGFNESLWRQFGEDDFASVCVLVTHGLMTRIFLMKWYHFSVEYFEDLRNVNHCEFVRMTRPPESPKYTLENQLRTWSELRRERAVAEGKELTKRASHPHPHAHAHSHSTASAPDSVVPSRRRWGGCPDGCTHGVAGGGQPHPYHYHYNNNSGTNNVDDAPTRPEPQPTSPIIDDDPRTPTPLPPRSSNPSPFEEENDPRGRASLPPSTSTPTAASPADGENPYYPFAPPPSVETARPLPRLLSPQRIALLHAGRDGGGSRSGVASEVGSDEREEEEDGEGRSEDGGEERDGRGRRGQVGGVSGVSGDGNGDGNRNGGGREDSEAARLKRVEGEERSVGGSVY
ncbi:MAG: hypothetical protein M1833_002738 [Piccolia ochrophora]|nr:MAG: hypothetical protein M1833_002738 [Piccolia ochrophora]